MKLDGGVLVLVAVMVDTGCTAADPNADLVAPEETVADAPEETANAAAAGAEKGPHAVHYYGPRPPAARVEPRGAAPSDRHFWAPGYYRWNGRDDVWYPGHWHPRRDGLEYVSPHWENIYGRWEYIPGVWFRAR